MLYYDGTKLLSLKDIDGNLPEIFICTANRTAGKTTYFNRLMVNKFKKDGSKFLLLYRYKHELDDCSDKFFKDIKTLFFIDDIMTHKRKAHGLYAELYLNDKSCGYAVPLNSADYIKKFSHLLSDVDRILFDEFQTESNTYCTKEVEKLQSIHTSIARGQGKQVRYVPVYMVSNQISIINPYYVALGISSRLNTNTKYLKGHGYVLENGFVDTAANAQKNSGFNKAFCDTDYLTSLTQERVYLNDNLSFVQAPAGKSNYIATLKYKQYSFAIREYPEEGIIYCDNTPDFTHPRKLAVTTEDHDINYVMLRANADLVIMLRYYFEHGCFRFKDLRCKEAILQALSY